MIHPTTMREGLAVLRAIFPASYVTLEAHAAHFHYSVDGTGRDEFYFRAYTNAFNLHPNREGKGAYSESRDTIIGAIDSLVAAYDAFRRGTLTAPGTPAVDLSEAGEEIRDGDGDGDGEAHA